MKRSILYILILSVFLFSGCNSNSNQETHVHNVVIESNGNGTHSSRCTLCDDYPESITEACLFDSFGNCIVCGGGSGHTHTFTEYVYDTNSPEFHIKKCECGYSENEPHESIDSTCSKCSFNGHLMIEEFSSMTFYAKESCFVTDIPSADGETLSKLLPGDSVNVVGLVSFFEGSPCSYYKLENEGFADTSFFGEIEYDFSTKNNWNLLSLKKEYINVSPGYYYCLYSDSLVTISQYDKDYSLLKAENYNSSSVAHYVTFDCEYISVSSSGNSYLMSTGIKRDNTVDKGLSFYVVSNDSPVSLNVTNAVKKLKNGGIILVLPGIYTEEVEGWDKTVNIMGLDKNTTVIQNSTGDYRTPPIEIGPGSLKSLTIRALGDRSWDFGCYAVHVENNYLAGKSLTISDCVLASESNDALGMGLREGSINISKCRIASIYAHDSDLEQFGGLQELNISDSTIDSFLFQSLDKESSDIRINLKNNTFGEFKTIGNNITIAEQ